VVLTFLRHNRRGRPIGKPVVSFVFQFSTAMDVGTTDNPNNYQVDSASTERVKKKRAIVLHPVAVQAVTYDPLRNSVLVMTSAAQKTFAKGGQLTIIAAPPSGVSSAANGVLAAPTVFTIRAGARRIKPL
jgi:hypothetical protein